MLQIFLFTKANSDTNFPNRSAELNNKTAKNKERNINYLRWARNKPCCSRSLKWHLLQHIKITPYLQGVWSGLWWIHHSHPAYLLYHLEEMKSCHLSLNPLIVGCIEVEYVPCLGLHIIYARSHFLRHDIWTILYCMR